MVVLNFKQKRVLTKGELYAMEKRVDEIEKTIDLCGDDDLDVLLNLEKELEAIIERLEND